MYMMKVSTKCTPKRGNIHTLYKLTRSYNYYAHRVDSDWQLAGQMIEKNAGKVPGTHVWIQNMSNGNQPTPLFAAIVATAASLPLTAGPFAVMVKSSTCNRLRSCSETNERSSHPRIWRTEGTHLRKDEHPHANSHHSLDLQKRPRPSHHLPQ